MTKIGSNQFKNVIFPLAFENRYFMLESFNGKDLWTVFTLQDEKPVIEILKNKPKKNNVSVVETNSTGIITVSDPTTGLFLYKLRPGNKNSSIFGRIKGKETEIRITDKEIRVGTNTFQNNIITGFMVGILVDRNGGISVGAGLPSEIQKLFRI